ncbi:unnamed protein product, partial [Lymnaea stagnalis]
VLRVTPQCGSRNGGTRITIKGENFARNYFNFGVGNENLGSKVSLVSLTTYNCDIHPDGSHESQITCYTIPCCENKYYIVRKQSHAMKYFTFQVFKDCTPTIESISPTSGLPGGLVLLYGYTVTSKYGANEPDEDLPMILRVYFGGQKCELRNITSDSVYGVFYNESTKKGHLTCKAEGTFIGISNISFLVSNAYGRSLPLERTKKVYSTGIGMYQTFTEISGLSQNQGSTAGGTRLTIRGRYFDETVAPVQVLIGGRKLFKLYISFVDTEIVCDTPKQTSNGMNHFSGNRGLTVYMQNGTTLDRTKAVVGQIDESSWSAKDWGNHAVHMVGYFVPVYSGNYKFCVKSTYKTSLLMSPDSDPGKMVRNLKEIFHNNILSVFLRYYTEVQYRTGSSNSFVTLIAHLLVTNMTNQETGVAEHEVQDIRFTSTVTEEIQAGSSLIHYKNQLEVTKSGNGGGTFDVQTVTISGDENALFVLGLDGVYTGYVEFFFQLGIIDFVFILCLGKISSSSVENEIKKLPSVNFNVKVDLTLGSSVVMVITSESSQGSISAYSLQTVDERAKGLTFEVVRTTPGKPSLDTYTLTMNDVPTRPIKLNGKSADLKNALDELFSVRCHTILKSGTYVQDYETDKSNIAGRANNIEPFCGYYSLKNPNFIYHKGKESGITVSTTNNRFQIIFIMQLCFAYKGVIKLIKVGFSFKNLDNKVVETYIYFYVRKDTPEEWKYHCEDVYTPFTSRPSNKGTGAKVIYVEAQRLTLAQDFYIDQLMFSRESIVPFADFNFNLWRLRQPESKHIFIETLAVEGAFPLFTIKMKPRNCGYNIPLLGVAGATVSTGLLELLFYYQQKSGSSYTINSQGSLSVKVTSIQEASPPIAGSFTVTFKGDTTAEPIKIPNIVSPHNLIGGLNSMSVGFSDVVATGKCSDFSYRVTMLSQTGDQPLMEINSKGVTGLNLNVTVQTITDGGVWFDPISGDMLRTYHTTPQVIAFINKVPTRCEKGISCAFSWSTAHTPSITHINPTSGSAGASVQISGSGFDASNPGNNRVIIGSAACSATKATATLITCTLGNGATSTADVKVIVDKKGLAQGSVKFTYITGVKSYSPKSGSFEGGTLITINGYGFTSDALVKIGGVECKIETIVESIIKCRSPKSTSTSTSEIEEINLSQPGSSLKVGTFTYDRSPTFTPVVTSISQSTSGISGGDTITINGKSFGDTKMPVKLGEASMTVTSYTDTKITAVLPPLPDGAYKLIIDVQGKGYADLSTNRIPDIVYTFQVTGMSPQFGSLYGGTDLFITGRGFSTNTSVMNVSVGPHKCDISEISQTSIKCRIANTGKRIDISATGVHKVYGRGYAWDKDPITIAVGDYITWHWETPQYVSDMSYSVQQTATPSDFQNMPGGFSSGPNSRKGSFTYRFTSPGNYYYWTGFMDSLGNVYFRGTVKVEVLKSYSTTLSLKISSFEASHHTSAANQPNQGSCPSATNTISGCTDSTNLDAVPGKFNFKFLKCYSPYISSINLKNGTFSDTITFSGKGFGTKACQNEVVYANTTCEIVSSTASAISLRISAANKPPVGEAHEFTTRVVNLGYALVDIPEDMSRRFGLHPRVSRITPSTGSTAGGTKITVSGEGFVGGVDKISVELDSLGCVVDSVTYTQIICETFCGSHCRPAKQNVRVDLPAGISLIRARCEKDSCSFTTTEAETATVTDVSPSSVSTASTTLTITGSKFGNSAEKLKVLIGGKNCDIGGSVANDKFSCTVGRLPVGENDVKVYVHDNGIASTDKKVTSQKSAVVKFPSSSSIYGGALMVIDGNGFTEDTTVKTDTAVCPVVKVSLSQISCTIPPHAPGIVRFYVKANKITYNTLSLKYGDDATPKVKHVTPKEGRSKDSITVGGSIFTSPAGSTPKVKIGGVECAVKSATATSITCTAGSQTTGQFPVEVFVEQLGFSNHDIMFTYRLGDFTINPNKGTSNGGQIVTLKGSGFLKNKTRIRICNAACTEVSVSTSEYICRTSNNPATVCDVTATVEGISKTLSGAYTYDNNMESTVTSVNPARGGTGGGTLLTISGTNFGTSKTDITVKIANYQCTVQTVSNNQITCKTIPAKSAVANVEVERNKWGLAKQVNAKFEYIDLWSNRYTWGGGPPPLEGDFVVIPAGKTILLDTNTPVLKMLLIQGGELKFDSASVELQAENILITNGGLLQIGTAEVPFPKQHKAIITLHGHLRSKELPIYGTKTIAVREGTLNLYGNPITVVWTRLAETATAGSKILNLIHSVDWKPGDSIVIATTGDRNSQKESEVRTIEAVNNNQVTLKDALIYTHLGMSGEWGGKTVEFRAEVGLLTRNIVVRGHRNVEFDKKIEACPDGFNTGEFATQTCFQGRFGEELGSDQFGAQIMIHQMGKDTQVAQAHIQYVELTFSGQAFRLGRYPIHFHLNGNMSESFVRGCAIHTSFNRAVNIHGSHNVLVEYNVLYNIMGGAFFLEDGDEIGNTFQYNLAVFVKSSTSLRNDDITPAGFWATNPNNTIRHNAVAGGTHFGSWYRMHKHPDGPGFNVNICPQAAPLKEYRNNTAHSLGWFGLWVFEKYVPRKGGSCNESEEHQAAKFYSLTAWNCDKGAEGVHIGAVQFHDFVLVNNEKAGFEGKLVVGKPPQYDADNGPGIFDSVIVAHYEDKLAGTSTLGGVVVPYMTGFLIQGVKFYNFNKVCEILSWTRIAGVCGNFCGGFVVETKELTFVDSPNKVKFAWESEAVVHDKDGTLSGTAGSRVVPCSPSYDSTKCKQNTEMSVELPGCVCTSDVNLIRFSFNKMIPTSVSGKKALFTSSFGTTESKYAEKRITHKFGWSVVLMANTYYRFAFEDAGRVINISYDSIMYGFDSENYLVFSQYTEEKPDELMMDETVKFNMSKTMLTGSEIDHGQWYYDADNQTVTYASKLLKRVSRQRRAAPPSYLTEKDLLIKTRITRCYYRGCEAPQDPMDILETPKTAEYWSRNSTWLTITSDGLEPKPMADLTIPRDKWIIVDKPIPKLGKVVIEGGLEFMANETRNMSLDVEYIHITGRLIAGWAQNATYQGNLLIRVRGMHTTPAYQVTSGPLLGSRFIGVFGGLQLHGKDRGIIKTSLATTVDSGNQITVTDNVSWVPGDIILITTTDYNPWHTETFSISSIAGNTVTLNSTIKYRHIADSLTVGEQVIQLRAVVALLTRHIKIEGEEYADLIKDSYGARVVVGQTMYNDDQRSGFAQISNVEFYHTGQEGFNENFDPRFSLAYIDVISTPGKIRYSYVKKSTFYSGFSTAIGAFAIDDLEIDDNIIHNTVNSGIRTESKGTIITNNLVALTIWTGTYHDRKEILNRNFEGSIEATKATDIVLINNTVAGAERTGYHLKGQPCSIQDDLLWSGNIVIGTLIGVSVMPCDTLADSVCVTYSGFTVWKNFDYGFYYNNRPSLVIKNSILIENGIGIFPMLVGPNAVNHEYTDKYVVVNDNVFVGKTSTFSETLDVLDEKDDILTYSPMLRYSGRPSPCGKIGVIIATFTSGSNEAPQRALTNIMGYGSIKGLTKLQSNTFFNFNPCPNGTDYAVTTSKNNDDACHPLHVENTQLINVNHKSKVHFDPPNVGKVVPADCVDMDCDGLKKCLIRDLDGTFLGHKGTVLPNSAYEWNGDKRHGVGDYRIPSAMLVASNGSKLEVENIAPHKGIYKTDNCTWVVDWHAFECADFYQWRLLAIESMDADTETRRLSPVAIYSPEGYVDLINGPQDHGWCSGYTCQKRLSLFQAIVAMDQYFEIYLSSVVPNDMRYMLLASDSKDCVRLKMWILNQNRHEVC